MILDVVSNIARYNIPFANGILSFLNKNDLKEPFPEELGILGRDLFVRPSTYLTRPAKEGRFETHQACADVQVVIEGEEVMQTASVDGLVPLTEYDPEKDCQFFQVRHNIADHIVKAGEFAIFWPGEPHRPCCQTNSTPSKVKKFVFKVRMI